VYIDGNHQYEFVLQDLCTFAPKVKVGGMICGDDYGRGKNSPITRPVKEFLKEASAEVIELKKHQYILKKH